MPLPSRRQVLRSAVATGMAGMTGVAALSTGARANAAGRHAARATRTADF